MNPQASNPKLTNSKGFFFISLLSIGLFLNLASNELLWATESGSAPNEAQIRSRIESVLSQRHPVDDPEFWQSLGSEAPGVIMKMYEEKHTAHEKLRLIESLAWYDTPETAPFLKKIYGSSKHRLTRSAAVRSVAASRGVKEEAFIDRAFAQAEPRLKVQVAGALEDSEDPQATRLVDRLMEREKNPWVISRIRKHRLERESESE